LQQFTAVYNCFFHALLEAVNDDEVWDGAAVLSVRVVRSWLPRSTMFEVSVLEHSRMGLDIGWPDDLLPVMWRVPPEWSLWVGLNSRWDENEWRRNPKKRGRENMDSFLA
jgi:hypothetical protein